MLVNNQEYNEESLVISCHNHANNMAAKCTTNINVSCLQNVLHNGIPQFTKHFTNYDKQVINVHMFTCISTTYSLGTHIIIVFSQNT